MNKFQEYYIRFMIWLCPYFYRIVFMMGWDYGNMHVKPKWMNEFNKKEMKP